MAKLAEAEANVAAAKTSAELQAARAQIAALKAANRPAPPQGGHKP